jgi:chromosome segregation ATPase
VKKLEEWRATELSKSTDDAITELTAKLEKIKEEQMGLLKPVKLLESKSFSYDAAINKLQNKLDETERNCEDVKGQLLDMQKSMLFPKDLKSSDIRALLSENDNFDTSVVINNSSLFQPSSDKKPSSDSAEISDFAAIQASTSTEYQ